MESIAQRNRGHSRHKNGIAMLGVKAAEKRVGTLDAIGIAMEFRRGSEIYGEAETADYIYKVVKGAVRVYKVLDDGRRQINAFYLTGDVFGLEPSPYHPFSAEAVTESCILVIKKSSLVALAARHSAVANELWSITALKLEHIQKLMVTLGRKTAHERVASFLFEMAERSPDQYTFELPMSRQDIADHLGLTIETVSRIFTQLEEKFAIELPASRRVVIKNRGLLADMSGISEPNVITPLRRVKAR
jgi:CRP/FNR family nitrogen fixation transcriptional regulator